MHLRLLAVGNRQPDWVRSACDRYSTRLPGNWRFEIVELDPGKGAKATPDLQAKALLARLRPSEKLIALDERGQAIDSKALAKSLATWQASGDDFAFVIGGADGLGTAIRQRASRTLALSAMTLPHGMARVLIVEQLYRAQSLLTGHPYHRE